MNQNITVTIIEKIKFLLHIKKSKDCTDKKISVIEETIVLWYHACILTIDKNTDLLQKQRPHLGTILYFLGSIDNMCQWHNINADNFIILAHDLLNKFGFKNELLIPVMKNFCSNPTVHKFALEANIAGGKDISNFIVNKNPLASFHFKELLEEWNKNPSLTEEEINLFFLK